MAAQKIPSEARTALVWMAAPGLLSVASQMGAMAYFARAHGPSEVVAFQTMLSLWAWTFVCALGMDRAGRAFAASASGLGDFASRWRGRLATGVLAGAAVGAAAGFQWTGGALAWSAYGAGLLACSVGYAGREWLFARGEVLVANRSLTMAFLVAILAMCILALAGAPFGIVAAFWFLPHVALWMLICRRMGLFSAQPEELMVAGSQAREERPYAMQALGHVATASLDVVLAQALISDPVQVLRYIVYSRLVSAAFMFSVNFAAVYVKGAVNSEGALWRAYFAKSALVHAVFAVAAVSCLAFVGPEFVKLWLGMGGVGISGRETAALALAGLARAVCEAGMQMLSGAARAQGARWVSAGYFAGLCALGAGLTAGWSPFGTLALSWAAPAAFLLAWVLVRGR